MKIPVIQREHYTVYYEGLQLPDGDVSVFVHCDVHKWSPSIKRALIKDFNTLTSLRNADVYCDRHSGKQEKFIRIFGFEYSYSVPDYNIDIYRLEIKDG